MKAKPDITAMKELVKETCGDVQRLENHLQRLENLNLQHGSNISQMKGEITMLERKITAIANLLDVEFIEKVFEFEPLFFGHKPLFTQPKPKEKK